MTTKQYNTEDFANAEFARHPETGRVAARVDRGHWALPWAASARPEWHASYVWLSDASMVEQGWVPVREAQPISLDSLHEAWENAEDADECNEGDIMISRTLENPTMQATVWRAPTTGPTGLYTRILHRAPKREPWQDLADVLRAHTGEPYPDETAKMLYERGVRMTEEMSAEYA